MSWNGRSTESPFQSFRRIALASRAFLANATARQILTLGRSMAFLRSTNVSVGLIAVTYRCQNDCVHCGVKGYLVRRSRELTREEIFDVVDQMSAMRIPVLVLFGGEPLIREDLAEMIAYATSRGMLVKIDTNGQSLDERRLFELKRARVNFIGVSIDSADAERHDVLRARQGNYARAVESVQLCVRHGVPVSVATYATRENIHNGELARVIRLGKELGATNVRVLEPTLSGRWLKEEAFLLTEDDRRVLATLLDGKFVYGRYLSGTCLAADRKLLFVSAYGDVQPCGLVPFAFGNIRTEPLAAIVSRMHGHRFLEGLGPDNCVANVPRIRLEYLSRVPPGAAPPWDIDTLGPAGNTDG